MLKTLLGRSQQSKEGSTTLNLYIVAASFPKMKHRMNNRRLSKHYLSCLTEMKLKTSHFTEPPHVATATAEPDSENPDQTLLDFLPGLCDLSNIDNLLAARDNNTEIYNKETFLEFHNLLCKLLLSFNNSLANLENLFQTKETTPKSVTDIRQRLRNVHFLGRSLRAMVTGAAIEKHLKVVTDLLEVDNGNSWVMGEDEEGDAEFDILGKFLPPWESYKNWLRLMVVYFDAESILSHFLSKYPSGTGIDIKILAPCLPPDGSKMLTWKNLLRHETYFPELPNDPGQPSAEELITFLTSDYVDMDSKGKCNEVLETGQGTSIQKVIESAKHIKERQELAITTKGIDMDGLTDALNSVGEQLSLLKSSVAPGSAECISAILKQIKEVQALIPERTPKARLLLIQDIEEGLETLKARSALYEALKEDQSLSTGVGFYGTRHCEICMAAFNSLSALPIQESSEYEAILREFKVSHIFMHNSKFCSILQCRIVDKL
jgi:hypothetical protein